MPGRGVKIAILVVLHVLCHLESAASAALWHESPTQTRATSAADILESIRGGKQVDRRWDALMSNCVGCWSGTIGWYDVDESDGDSDASSYDDSSRTKADKRAYKLTPRRDNNKRNMRLSFLPRPSDSGEPEVADWIVYHARAQGVKQSVALYKDTKLDPMENNSVGFPKQKFYCFRGGIIGRSGIEFGKLPVIEHGFFDEGEGMRRTVVLTYESESGRLDKICFLQQKKKAGKHDGSFDVAAVERRDVRIMPKESRMSLDQMRQRWIPKGVERAEVLTVSNGRYKEKKTDSGGALASLLGSKKESDATTLRIALPNGVVLACPWSVKSENFEIGMGYKRKSGEVQIVRHAFEKCKLKKVTASWVNV